MWTDIQMKRYLGRYQRSSVPMKSEAHQGSMSRWLSGKESACSLGDVSSIPGSGRSPWRNWQLMPAFLPGKSRGQRSLMGYSPCGGKVLDMTERLSKHTCKAACRHVLIHQPGGSLNHVLLGFSGRLPR